MLALDQALRQLQISIPQTQLQRNREGGVVLFAPVFAMLAFGPVIECVGKFEDNCPGFANTSQDDCNCNGMGDACDTSECDIDACSSSNFP